MSTVLLKKEDIHKGYLILVNREYGYHEQCQELSHAGMWNGEEILYERRANRALDDLMKEIGGWEHIVPVSAWRSMAEQQAIWDQSGLAMDLGLRQEEIDFIRPYFPYEGICQTFRERAAAYGFVERYQADKQSVTQIGHEPWHFRYVGTPHAQIMAQKKLALEEYITFIKDHRYNTDPYDFREYQISFAEAAGEMTVLELDDAHPYSISGNNCDGFIVTQRIGRERNWCKGDHDEG